MDDVLEVSNEGAPHLPPFYTCTFFVTILKVDTQIMLKNIFDSDLHPTMRDKM